MKSSKDIEKKKSEITYNELGMIEISDQELLEQIAGGMASTESQENLADGQCNCTNGNCSCTSH